MKTSFTIPDFIEPIYAWRSWSVNSDYSLRASTFNRRWEAKVATKAICLATDAPLPHSAPQDYCTCGLHGTKHLEIAMKYTSALHDPPFNSTFEPYVSALGITAMWGRVVEHESGWRSEFAFPQIIIAIPSRWSTATVAHLGKSTGRKPSYLDLMEIKLSSVSVASPPPSFFRRLAYRQGVPVFSTPIVDGHAPDPHWTVETLRDIVEGARYDTNGNITHETIRNIQHGLRAWKFASHHHPSIER